MAYEVSAWVFAPNAKKSDACKFINGLFLKYISVYTFLQDENEWLREELEDTERRLEDVLARLAHMEEEKQHWLFIQEVSLFAQIFAI